MDTKSHSPIHLSKENMSRDRHNRSPSMDRRREHSPEPRSRSRHRHHSRSRSVTPRRRSHSRSPAHHRVDLPPKSRCLGVFGLSVQTTKEQIMRIFEKFGPIDGVQVVYDAKTRRSRGYCFVYFKNTSDAKVAKEQCTGMEIDARVIRVDYSITQRAHSPTPGVYKGQLARSELCHSSTSRRSRYRDDPDDYSSRSERPSSSRRDRRSPSHHSRDRRSPSYHRRRRYDRSYSRSYSPRDRRYR